MSKLGATDPEIGFLFPELPDLGMQVPHRVLRLHRHRASTDTILLPAPVLSIPTG